MKHATRIILNGGRQITNALPHCPDHERAIGALLNEILITASHVEGVTRDELEAMLKTEGGPDEANE